MPDRQSCPPASNSRAAGEVFATIRTMSTSNMGKPVALLMANESRTGPLETRHSSDPWSRLRAISLRCVQQPVCERSQFGIEYWKFEVGNCRAGAPVQGSILNFCLSILNCVFS